MIKTTYSFVGAVLAAYILGAIFVSQGNIASVIALGFEVSGGQRIDAALHDILHMTDIYLPLVTVSLLLGLPVAFAVIRKKPHLRTLGYVLAGFVALIAMPVIMKLVLGLSGMPPLAPLSDCSPKVSLAVRGDICSAA